jgi:GT2 family glycosyltransferase
MGSTVDVVICAYTHERWELLCRAVRSVQQQTRPPSAILVCVDHNDSLFDRCLQRWPDEGQPEVPRVKVLRNRYPGRLGSARNTALEQVRSEFTAFLDDDAEAETTWLAALMRVYEDTDAVAVGGAPMPRFETCRPGWFPPEFDWVFGCHYRGLPSRRQPIAHLIGASMSVRTDALRSVGGFHSDLHDDMDLSHRIAASFGASSVVYEPEARISHFVPRERVTWRYFWRRCYTVNRSKVRALADMGYAGNLSAELRFGRLMVAAVARDVARGARGDTDAVAQAAAIVAGLGVAGIGHLRGSLDLRGGRLPESLTVGLQPV